MYVLYTSVQTDRKVKKRWCMFYTSFGVCFYTFGVRFLKDTPKHTPYKWRYINVYVFLVYKMYVLNKSRNNS